MPMRIAAQKHGRIKVKYNHTSRACSESSKYVLESNEKKIKEHEKRLVEMNESEEGKTLKFSISRRLDSTIEKSII
jgi:hypothetical protein